jgi:hypothetical protein
MKLRHFLILTISGLLVTACGPRWVKPDATTDQVRADIAACERVAEEQFPVEMSSTDTSNRKEYTTRCTNHGNQTNCSTRSSDSGGKYQHDRNKEKRQQAIGQCMRSSGYSRQ